MRGVPAALLGTRAGVVEEPAVLRDEQDKQLVDDPQQQPVVLAWTQRPVPQRFPHGGRGGEEATAEDAQRVGDTEPQGGQRAGAAGGAFLAPAFQPAGRGGRGRVRLRLDAAGVANLPEQREVGEHLAVEHALQIELDVGLADEGRGVPQQPQRKAVGDQAPQMILGPVEQLLEQGVRGLFRRAAHIWGAAVQRHAGAEQVDGGALPLVGQRIGDAVDAQPTGGDGRQPPVTELLEQDAKPPGSGGFGQRLGVLAGWGRATKRQPGRAQAVPGPVGRLADGLPVGKPEVAGPHAGQVVAAGDRREDVG